MSNRAAAVVYAKNLHRLTAFYARAGGMVLLESASDYVVLESDRLELSLVAIPPHLAANIEIAVPPELRESSAVKLALHVPSLAQARAQAAEAGGALKGVEAEWLFRQHRICDGYDPEGNVVQFRETIV